MPPKAAAPLKVETRKHDVLKLFQDMFVEKMKTLYYAKYNEKLTTAFPKEDPLLDLAWKLFTQSDLGVVDYITPSGSRSGPTKCPMKPQSTIDAMEKVFTPAVKSWISSDEPNSVFAKHAEEMRKRLHPQLTIPSELKEQNSRIDALIRSRPQTVVAGEDRMLEELKDGQKLLGVGSKTRSRGRTSKESTQSQLIEDDDSAVYSDSFDAGSVLSDPMDNDLEELAAKRARPQFGPDGSKHQGWAVARHETQQVNESFSSGRSSKTEIDCGDVELDSDCDSYFVVVKRNRAGEYVAVKRYVHFNDGSAVASYLARNSTAKPFKITSIEGFSRQIAELEDLKAEIERLGAICSALPSKMRDKLKSFVTEQEELARKEREDKENANKRLRQDFAEAFGVDEKILDG